MAEVPEIEVEIVDIGAPIGCVGEPGLLSTAPAVTNTIFATMRQRRRGMPLGEA